MTDYNNVFERLYDPEAEQDEVLVGLVAYGLYKVAKREWLIAFCAEHNRKPNEEECRAYARTQTGAALEGYQSKATIVVAAFSNTIIEDEKPGIVADALKGSFWSSFWPSYISSFAFAVSLIVIVVILNYFGLPLPVISKE